jgi:hypothetical protein
VKKYFLFSLKLILPKNDFRRLVTFDNFSEEARYQLS